MALEKVRVLVEEGAAQTFPMNLAANTSASEYTKAAAEEVAGSGQVAKAIEVVQPVKQAKVITFNTEASAQECVNFVRAAIGGIQGKISVVKGTSWEEK